MTSKLKTRYLENSAKNLGSFTFLLLSNAIVIRYIYRRENHNTIRSWFIVYETELCSGRVHKYSMYSAEWVERLPYYYAPLLCYAWISRLHLSNCVCTMMTADTVNNTVSLIPCFNGKVYTLFGSWEPSNRIPDSIHKGYK